MSLELKSGFFRSRIYFPTHPTKANNCKYHIVMGLSPVSVSFSKSIFIHRKSVITKLSVKSPFVYDRDDRFVGFIDLFFH